MRVLVEGTPVHFCFTERKPGSARQKRKNTLKAELVVFSGLLFKSYPFCFGFLFLRGRRGYFRGGRPRLFPSKPKPGAGRQVGSEGLPGFEALELPGNSAAWRETDRSAISSLQMGSRWQNVDGIWLDITCIYIYIYLYMWSAYIDMSSRYIKEL